jgi:hypothetical protein
MSLREVARDLPESLDRNKATRFVVRTDGDPSVGISGDEAVLFYDLTPFAESERREIADHIKAGLREVFHDLMGGFPLAVTVPCPTCGGEGEIFAGYDSAGGEGYERCPDCDGKGEPKFMRN